MTQKAPRRLGSWAAAILFVVLVVIGLLALFQAQGNRVEVLAVTKPVPAGQVIEASDVHAIQVAGVPDAIAASDIDSVVGKRASTGLVEGQILTPGAVTGEPIPGDGQRLVALQLPPGRVPGGLAPGAVVSVLVAPQDGSAASASQLQDPQSLTDGAQVQSVGKTPDGNKVVTVLVKDSVAESIAAYSAAGQVTIVQAPISTAKE
ncbi:SAF domain-containing protein [Nocardioides cheoyonin]|uniref:SAF domain-containing protein n=1 Tax=Nocardioides cheoyonin TaxID=3156615 RepID=UPI0032B501CE